MIFDFRKVRAGCGGPSTILIYRIVELVSLPYLSTDGSLDCARRQIEQPAVKGQPQLIARGLAGAEGVAII